MRVFGFLENKSKKEVVSKEEYEQHKAEIKDYVIERGTMGKWRYQKWHSGYCELSYIAEHTFSIVNPFGNVYRSERIQVRLPFPMINRYSGSVSASIATGWGNIASMTQDLIDVYLYAGGNSGKITNYINLHITGTWK